MGSCHLTETERERERERERDRNYMSNKTKPALSVGTSLDPHSPQEPVKGGRASVGLDSPLGEEEEAESKLGCALGRGVATASSLGCVEEDGGGEQSSPQARRKKEREETAAVADP